MVNLSDLLSDFMDELARIMLVESTVLHLVEEPLVIGELHRRIDEHRSVRRVECDRIEVDHKPAQVEDRLACADSHAKMTNLRPDTLAGRARCLSGRHKPLYMMQGLDASFDAVFFVSYHGSMEVRCGRDADVGDCGASRNARPHRTRANALEATVRGEKAPADRNHWARSVRYTPGSCGAPARC
ncbi:M55 family metallopeptidase [Streptomyces sp. NPDC002536]